MKKRELLQSILKGIYRYLLFFILVAFLVTCCMYLFVGTLAQDLGIVLTGDNLNRAAKLTFLNVIILSVIFTVIDVVRRKLTTEKITKHIVFATRELVKGKFETRISKVGRFVTDSNYNEIIDCFNKIAMELGSIETLRTDFISNV